jgi:hypothetical protein
LKTLHSADECRAATTWILPNKKLQQWHAPNVAHRGGLAAKNWLWRLCEEVKAKIELTDCDNSVNLMIHCINRIRHGLWTPNEGIEKRYLKNWADVAEYMLQPYKNIWEWE